MCSKTYYDEISLRNHDRRDAAAVPAPSRRDVLTRALLLGAGLAAAPALALDLLAPRPAEALQLVGKPSADQQKQVGREAAKQILAKYKEVNDSRATAFKSMGAKLVAALPEADRAKWDYNFHVIDSKEVNAFALPGGPMFMFTGLYDKLTSMDALAAVTGHEMTHVRKEHWAKAYQQEQSRNLLVGIGLTILHAGNTANTLAQLATSAISLKYSRGEESQADQGGLENMTGAGYNPQGMIQLFQTLQKLSGNGGGLGGDFLSDHPLTSDRIKAAQKWIDQHSNKSWPALTPIVKG